MNKQKLDIIYGALLHDIGKVLFRCHDTRVSHSQSGAKWLNEIGISDNNIIDQIRYHHAQEIRNTNSKLASDSLAFITYWADNVAAGADRRDSVDNQGSRTYKRDMALESVFNILNGNKDKYRYMFGLVNEDGEINYPVNETRTISAEKYSEILDNLKDLIKGADIDEKNINSFLEVLEANLTFVPSSTDTNQICDVSLFDHIKITSAVASSVYDYLVEQGNSNYRDILYKKGDEFYNENAFLLCSMDISGIQNFIYTISSSKALKNLRARSFYLEIMMEHIVDQLLAELELSRANLLYTGGGHAYLLLPNTSKCRNVIDDFGKRLNHWLMHTFGIDIYMAIGYAECKLNDPPELVHRSTHHVAQE